MIEEPSFLEKVPDWLRWVLLLPLLGVTILLVAIIAEIAVSGLFVGGGLLTGSDASEALKFLLDPVASLVVATTVAPKGKFVIGIIINVLYSIAFAIVVVVSFFIFYYDGFDSYLLLTTSAAIVGPVIAIIYLFVNKDKLILKKEEPTDVEI